MTIERTSRDCTVVLHDDAVSRNDTLCGQHVLTAGEIGLLKAANARTLTLAPKASAKNADEVSVHISIARRLGIENRTKGKVKVLEVENDAVATHVEITFRDQHLSRADMWRMKAETEDRVAYKGQRLKYLGSTAAEVANVYIAGQEVDSALISYPRTRLIFRSHSARYTILVHVSKEMMQYWNDGDLMYERLVSGFLPELFRRWEALKMRHQVTVVIFGRRTAQNMRDSDDEESGSGKPSDFFRVLVSEMPSTDWRLLLRKLKKAFHEPKLPSDLCLAAEGNLLEAFHLTAMDFADDNLAPPASSTGTSIIAVTAGAGLFEADRALLKSTTELLLGNSIGVDIVSLSPKPLHPVPLFQYDLDDKTEYALPHWLDISYWDADAQPFSNWLFPSSPEQVQDVALRPIAEQNNDSFTTDSMLSYDDDMFEGPKSTLKRTLSADTTINTTENVNSHAKTGSKESTHSFKGIDTNDMQPKPLAKTKSKASNEDSQPASSTASVPLTNRAKREGLPPHPLMQNFRKISVGPKGLAPSQGVASTTVSAHHVQQDREVSGTASASNENPSLLARQIRDSLRGKPSQRMLAAHQVQEESAEGSKPIVIRTSDELPHRGISPHNKSDPASLIEKAVMDRESGPNSGSYSATPRGKRGSLPLHGLSSIDEQDGSNTPWLTLLNPCDPKRNNMRIASEYRKWQNVFPRAISSGAFKWDSMCSPASLPLMTEVRVSMTDLERYFTKRVRRLLVMHETSPATDHAQEVLHQLVALRLTAGFQIVPTRKLRKEQTAADHIEKIILSLGSYYHELRYLSPAELQVIEYERSQKAGVENDTNAAAIYTARVEPVLSRKKLNSEIKFGSNPLIQEWSVLDDQCANPIAATHEQGVCKMRFVLIPIHTQQSERSTLSDEERRIDGIQKLTLMWQRHRYIAVEDQEHHASMAKPKGTKVERDPNPLAIEYQTRDPSVVVSGFDNALADPGVRNGDSFALFPDSEKYHSRDFDITKLVKHMQEPPPAGVELRDRRWFTRMHFKCFRGDEMCNWILHAFKDLAAREEAVALGNQLMHRDIFTHVRGKHEFRDGHYLYQIKGAYRTTDYPDNAGLFSKGVGKSLPSTPMAEVKQSPSIRATQVESESSSRGTPVSNAASGAVKERKTVMLTEQLRYNVDPNKKSDQLEVVNLHYDRIHNPENCYHIQLDWTNTTPKLIRESVARWASAVEGHSLKLVQLPMKEVCKLHEQHPLDQPVPVKLAVRPPKKVLATPLLDAQGASPNAGKEDPNSYHKALLRKLDFVLDLEGASSFPKTVGVSYSWGKPDFRLTQFIHKSGLLLAQVANTDEADFLMLQNRLASQPSASGSGKKSTEVASAVDVAAKLKGFCRDEQALKAFYAEANKSKAELLSPLATASAAMDGDVPPIELPPHVVQKVRS